MLTKAFIFNAHHQGLRLSIGRCRCYFFPHPLSQLLVTALRSIPANYPHEFSRTKTAQCERSEARPPPPTSPRTRAVLRPGMGGGYGRARHFGSAVSPYLESSQLEIEGESQAKIPAAVAGEDRDNASICGEWREISSR